MPTTGGSYFHSNRPEIAVAARLRNIEHRTMLARLYMDTVMTNETEQMKEFLMIAIEQLSEQEYSQLLSTLAQRIYADITDQESDLE